MACGKTGACDLRGRTGGVAAAASQTSLLPPCSGARRIPPSRMDRSGICLPSSPVRSHTYFEACITAEEAAAALDSGEFLAAPAHGRCSRLQGVLPEWRGGALLASGGWLCPCLRLLGWALPPEGSAFLSSPVAPAPPWGGSPPGSWVSAPSLLQSWLHSGTGSGARSGWVSVGGDCGLLAGRPRPRCRGCVRGSGRKRFALRLCGGLPKGPPSSPSSRARFGVL